MPLPDPASAEFRPLVSIVTVSLNSAATIGDTLRSVRAQTYPHVEHIVIDGVSTDGTVDIIRRHEAQLAAWISEPDCGLYDAMNKGIARAGGELIGIVNADDYLEPDAVAAAVEAYRRHPGGEVFHGKLRMINTGNGQTHVVGRPRDPRANRFREIPVLHPTAFVTRACYDRVGLYDTAYRWGSDYEFFLRCVARGAEFHYLERVLSNMRSGGVSNRKFVATFREARAIRRKYGCPWLAAQYSFVRSCALFYGVNVLLARGGLYRWYTGYKNRAAGPDA